MFFKRKPKGGLSNIYHITIHKAGSQWLKSIFADAHIKKASGLQLYNYEADMRGGYDPRNLDRRTFDAPFPEGTIVSPIYMDYVNYTTIPKPARFKTFYVIRDPRDLVVSHYFSKRYSHALMGGIATIREKLNKMSVEDGMIFICQCLKGDGSFNAMRTWGQVPSKDKNTKVFRFEDLTGPDQTKHFKTLCRHLELDLPEEKLEKILSQHSFQRLAHGRKQGEENQNHHYRKGIHGDWKNYFSPKVEEAFAEQAGDLLNVLDY